MSGTTFQPNLTNRNKNPESSTTEYPPEMSKNGEENSKNDNTMYKAGGFCLMQVRIA